MFNKHDEVVVTVKRHNCGIMPCYLKIIIRVIYVTINHCRKNIKLEKHKDMLRRDEILKVRIIYKIIKAIKKVVFIVLI